MFRFCGIIAFLKKKIMQRSETKLAAYSKEKNDVHIITLPKKATI